MFALEQQERRWMGITDAIYLGEGPAIMLYDWNNTSCLGNIVPTELSR